MKLKITGICLLFSISFLGAIFLAAQETPKLPPTPLQLLIDKDASREADLKLGDIENLLRNHRRELFSDDLDMKKFSLLRKLCEDLKKIPEAKELQPLLLKVISDQKAIDRPPVGWNEILVAGFGGGIGLLMDCVIGISGAAGFNQIFDSVVNAQDPVKMKILLVQVAIRNERAQCDPIVGMKLKTIHSRRLEEVVDAHLKAAATAR